jgi:hypothetical protein
MNAIGKVKVDWRAVASNVIRTKVADVLRERDTLQRSASLTQDQRNARRLVLQTQYAELRAKWDFFVTMAGIVTYSV